MASIATVTVRDFRELGEEDTAADVHLAQQPAAENVTILIGVGGHRDDPDGGRAGRFRGLFRGCFRGLGFVVHPLYLAV